MSITKTRSFSNLSLAPSLGSYLREGGESERGVKPLSTILFPLSKFGEGDLGGEVDKQSAKPNLGHKML